jgi:hypothetical protein
MAPLHSGRGTTELHSAATGCPGVRVHRPPTDRTVHAVSVDHRHLPAGRAGVAEVQAVRDDRNHRRRGHRKYGRTPCSGAGQVRHRRAPTLHGAHHYPERAGRGLTRSPAHPAGTEHPWTGWTFSAGWGTRQNLDPVLVEPGMVVEVGIDVARDAGGPPCRPYSCMWRPWSRPDQETGLLQAVHSCSGPERHT